MSTEDFNTWLGSELNKRGWSIRELARRANVSPGSISNAMTGLRNPGVNLCQNLAKALGLPEEEIFRNAGLLPQISMEKKQLEQLIGYFRQLSPEMREKAISVIKSLIDER